MLGDSGCGKTALVSQFMTSEYMHTYDASLGKSYILHRYNAIFLLNLFLYVIAHISFLSQYTYI